MGSQRPQKITLEAIYKAVQKMQQELHQINEKLSWENEFTKEDENNKGP
jgi:hypothetical protein